MIFDYFFFLTCIDNTTMALTPFIGNRCPDEYILSYGSFPISNLFDEFVCCQFSIHKQQENICAFGTEHGKVLICDVMAPIKGAEFVKNRFSTGESAVFNLCFIPERPNLLLSLCGGSRLELRDIEQSSSVLLNGHHDSVRCASVWPGNPFLVLTGSRDGAILLWDLREKPFAVTKGISRKNTTSKSVSSIRAYQTAHETSIPITGILHMSENYFISSSSSSASGIRIWDLRYQIASSPLRSLFVPQKMSKESGVASMCWDRFRSSFFALCTDNAIYEYVPSLNSTFPVRSFRANFINSFFVQCATSPFSDHILCGSSFSKAFIWDLQENRKYFQDVSSHDIAFKRTKKFLPNPKFVLNGHEKEVECVQWSSKGHYMLTMDSEVVRIWSRWTNGTENGYPDQVVMNHRPIKFTYPEIQTNVEEEVSSSSQTLSQRTFGSENRTDNDSRCSEENDIQLVMAFSPSRTVFNALDNLPALYAKITNEKSPTKQMEERRTERRIVIKSNLNTTPANKIPRVEGHDHITPTQNKTPKGKGRNLTAQLKSCGSIARKRRCTDSTSPLSWSKFASNGTAKKRILSDKKRANLELVKLTNSTKISNYFVRLQNHDNHSASSSSQ